MKRPNKYAAKKVTVDGITFHSSGEAARYRELKLLERAGLISSLEFQPCFPLIIDGKPLRGWKKDGLGRPLKVYLDFSFVRNGVTVYEDFKGVDTPVSRLKRALVEHIYQIKVTVTGRGK